MALAQPQARLQQTYLAQQGMGRGGPSGLAEVLDVLLDKGLVVDAFVRVSLVGIELLTIDARVVVASVDTYLRFAEAVNRLDLLAANQSKSLGDLAGGGSRALASGAPRDEPHRDDSGHETDEPEQRDEEEPDEPRADGAGEPGLLGRIKERGQVF